MATESLLEGRIPRWFLCVSQAGQPVLIERRDIHRPASFRQMHAGGRLCQARTTVSPEAGEDGYVAWHRPRFTSPSASLIASAISFTTMNFLSVGRLRAT